MSETPSPAPEARQFNVNLFDAALDGLAEQKNALGFHSANAVAAIGLTALAAVPPDKFWEVLAKIQAYHRPPAKPRKSR